MFWLGVMVILLFFLFYYEESEKNKKNSVIKNTKKSLDKMATGTVTILNGVNSTLSKMNSGLESLSKEIEEINLIFQANSDNRLASSIHKKYISLSLEGAKDHLNFEKSTAKFQEKLDNNPELRNLYERMQSHRPIQDTITYSTRTIKCAKFELPLLNKTPEINEKIKNNFQNIIKEHNEYISSVKKELDANLDLKEIFQKTIINHEDALKLIDINKFYIKEEIKNSLPISSQAPDTSCILGKKYSLEETLFSNQTTYTNSKNKDELDKYGIQYIYHMTHYKNLENILKNGLLPHNNTLSTQRIDNRGVNNRRNKLDPIHKLNLHSYVPFYFNPRNPMLYVNKEIQDEIIILAFCRNLLSRERTVFTDGNATVSTTNFYNKIDDLNKLNWKCLNSNSWSDIPNGKSHIMAEILVPSRVEIYSLLQSKLKKIYCYNNDMQHQVLEKINFFVVDKKLEYLTKSKQPFITAEVNPNFYF